MQMQKTSVTLATAVATNGTITFAYPSGQSSSTVITGSGAKLFAVGLQRMFAQGASNFSMAYGGSAVATYLGATSIPAGTVVDLFIPVPEYTVKGRERDNWSAPDKQPLIAAIAGSTGTADGTWDAVGSTSGGDVSAAIKNNFAEVNTKIVAIVAALVAAGIMSAT